MPIRIVVQDRLTGEPIPYAVVRLRGRDYVVNERGEITIDTPAEALGAEETLAVRSAHYEPVDRTIVLDTKKVIIRLRPEII